MDFVYLKCVGKYISKIYGFFGFFYKGVVITLRVGKVMPVYYLRILVNIESIEWI